MSMLDKVTTAIGIKADIADAIEAKGVSMTGVAFADYADKIAEISTGVDPSDATATDGDVLATATYYARNSTKHTGSIQPSTVTETTTQAVITAGYLASDVTITKGGTMPSIPSAFTDLSLNTSYTASGDGWVKFKVAYYWGMGLYSYLTIGSRTYQITASGEDQDMGWIEMEGIAPVYSGETFEMTTTGSASSHAYLKVAYL